MALRGTDALAFTAGSLQAPHHVQTPPAKLPAQAPLAASTAASGMGQLASAAVVGVAAAALARQATRRGVKSQSVVSRAAVAVSVGEKVSFKGMSGTVKFTGSVDFASGEWVGVALDEPKGLHDGKVFNVSYFECAPKHGIFCQPSDLAGSAAAPAPPAPAAPVAAAPVSTPAPAAGGAPASVAVGQKVMWNGIPGTVQFFGKVGFASGEWAGVQLDEPKGMHDGTVFNVPYFTCPSKTGIFCTPADIGGAAAAPAAAPAAPATAATPAAAAPAASAPLAGNVAVGDRVVWQGIPGTVEYVGQVTFATSEMVGVALDEAKGMHEGSLFGETYFSCSPKHGIFCEASSLQAGSGAAPSSASAHGHAAAGDFAEGQRVMWSGLSGVVKFCGSVNFASGRWVGIELDQPRGTHNGTVFNETYFTCRPQHGVFVQPFGLKSA